MLRPSEQAFAQAVAELAVVNPFQQELVARHENRALSIDLPPEVKNKTVPLRAVQERPNISRVVRKAEALADVVRNRLDVEGFSNEEEGRLYEELVLFVLYFRFRDRLQATVESQLEGSPSAGPRVSYFKDFARDVLHYLHFREAHPQRDTAAHIFAGFFQIRRAFQLIHANIFGQSRPAARLRCDVWQSIFTHDLRRYREALYKRMHDVTTLITGPSGTGKDLVAEAIGLSRYVAFDSKTERFMEPFQGAFHPVNLAALPVELIESELFGHCKGAFTGAVKDRIGWLETCQRSHSVFLDEIGELASTVQVKLLRVLQNRTFQRLGETRVRRFEGKVIAATNRFLDVEVQEGRFRRDFYYRLCSDIIRTPSLQEQLNDSPKDLQTLVSRISCRLYGEIGASLSGEVVDWIGKNLGLDYAWPGNIRELEQCIRNVLIRREYQPLRDRAVSPFEELLTKVRGCELTADELFRWYCTLVYAQTHSYSATALKLNLDRRTVRDRIDQELLGRLRHV
jgi:transcriptional regulator with AAA-type ATPase domain